MVAKLLCGKEAVFVDSNGIVRCNHNKISPRNCPKKGNYKGVFLKNCIVSFKDTTTNRGV